MVVYSIVSRGVWLLTSCLLSVFRDGSDLSAIRKILNDLDVQPSDEDCRIVRRVCKAVSTRGARLAAGVCVCVCVCVCVVKFCRQN